MISRSTRRAVAGEAHDRLGLGAGVLERVGQRLLDEAVDRQLHRPRAAPPESPLDLERRRGRPACADLLEQAGRSSASRAAARARLAAVLAQDAEQPAHVGERLAAGRRREVHRPHRLVGIAPHPALAPSASAIITERLWATMSCSSRAIRARSAAAEICPCWSRSRSRRPARSSSADEVLAPHPGVAAEGGGGDDHPAEEDEGEDRVVGRPPHGGEKHAELEDGPGGDRAPPAVPAGRPRTGRPATRCPPPSGPRSATGRGRRPRAPGRRPRRPADARAAGGSGPAPTPTRSTGRQGPRRRRRRRGPAARRPARGRATRGVAVEKIAGFERPVHLSNPHTSRRFICQAATARVATA